jgi:ABC-type glycerol-3-phosphate transport system permease component
MAGFDFGAIVKEILQDAQGYLSFKRVSGAVCLLLIVIAFVGNMFFGYKIEEFIFNGVMFILGACLGLTVPEKFSKFAHPDKPSTDDEKV